MANPTIRFKRGTQSAFGSVGLNTGEPAFITDEFNFYVGTDGTSANNKFFGSSRYWKKETTTAGGGVNLVGSHAVGVAGTSITLAAPTSVGTAVTYTFPATPTANYILTTDSSGTLSWTNALPSGTFSGITTFTNTTDNTLGNADTGAVQIDGGLGVNKNVTVGAGLSVVGDVYVAGVSTFVGNVTFNGGTLTLGDAATDNVVFGADVNSNVIPNTDATYDFGTGAQRWRNANFSGVVTATTFVGAVTGTATTATRALLVDTTTAPNGTFYPGLFVSSTGTASTSVYVDAGISYVSNTDTLTLTGDIAVNGGDVTTSATTFNLINGTATNVNFAGAATALVMGAATGITTVNNSLYATTARHTNVQALDGTTAITITNSTGAVATNANLTVGGDLYVNGTTTQVNTTTLSIEDQLIELGKVDGNAPSSDLNKDVGLLLHWYDTAARLAAVFWDDSTSRVAIASSVTESSGVLTVPSGQFAAVEFKELYISDSQATADVLVSYTSIGGVTGRHLQNIIVDGGTF